ncbi:MAG: hypothetical protein H7096_00895 [Flavobacterium sp.]|nr:hypothetical protein [Pedobacter sp.]
MKTLLSYLLFAYFMPAAFSQNISGKWYGKITQQPGGYSQLYDFELDLNQRKNIWGNSYAHLGDSVEIEIGLSGYIAKDTIHLSESRDWVRYDKVPWNWIACIKNINVVYRKENNNEYLEGRWTGVSKELPYEKCIPGRIILSRTIAGLNNFLLQYRDSVIMVEVPVVTPTETLVPDFKSTFMETEPKKVTEIEVFSRDLKLQLSDYLRVDNDTVSVYLNRKLLAKDIRVSKRATIINFSLDPTLQRHEILLFAENLGQIPPNTSELLIVDGKFTHRVMIVSDKQKTAAVYLKLKSGNK